MISITYQSFIDICLVDSHWVQISLDLAETKKHFQSVFLDTYKKALALAVSKQCHKIEVDIPWGWQDLREFFNLHQFQPGLVEWVRISSSQLTSLKSSAVTLQIKDQPVEFALVKELLWNQAQYHASHYPGYYLQPEKIDWTDYQRHIGTEWQQHATLGLTAWHEQEVVGLGIGERRGGMFHFYEFMVKPQWRSKRVGSFLLKNLLERLHKEKIYTTTLETCYNQPVRRLYERAGFVPIYQSFWKKV